MSTGGGNMGYAADLGAGEDAVSADSGGTVYEVEDTAASVGDEGDAEVSSPEVANDSSEPPSWGFSPGGDDYKTSFPHFLPLCFSRLVP